MPGRSNANSRCGQCRMYLPLCLCAEIPRIQLDTRIIVLMHWREHKLTTNTATLACLALSNSELHLRGRLESPLQLDPLLADWARVALLYPTDDAIELTPQVVAQIPRPMTWIVPDGSWRQARKVSLREKALARVPRYKLPDGLPSTYRLRHTVHERNLSTFEAIARMLGIVEGYPVQAELEKLFLKMVERTLWSRGNLTPEQCSTEIPAAAILASYIAGAAGSRKPEATLASLNVEPGIV